MFPQVSLQGLKHRLDFLVCVRLPDRCVWLNLEVDGTGHKPRNDAERAAAIGLPRVKLTEADILAKDFEQRLLEKLRRTAEDPKAGTEASAA